MERKHREPLTNEELQSFEGNAATIFARMGMDLNTRGARETPLCRGFMARLWMKANQPWAV